MRCECPGERGVYTYIMTKRILASVMLLGSLSAGGAAFADEAKKAPAKEADPAAIPKCRAVDPANANKVLAEAEDRLTTKCVRLLQDKLKAGACAEDANKGKKLELVTQFDHMIGKTKMRDGTISMTCPK